jgi:hypothetical protein
MSLTQEAEGGMKYDEGRMQLGIRVQVTCINMEGGPVQYDNEKRKQERFGR